MTQYIGKNKIKEEIERRISLFKKEKKIEKWSAGASQMNVVSLGARIAMLEETLSFLDTLEVKEVDLEKEYERYYEQERNIQTFKLAKYFFELGLKVQKGE